MRTRRRPSGQGRFLGYLLALRWSKSGRAGLAALARPQLTQRYGRRVLLARRFGRGVIRYLARGDLDRPKGRFVHVARSTLGLIHDRDSNAGKHGRQEKSGRGRRGTAEVSQQPANSEQNNPSNNGNHNFSHRLP